jgi:cytochrome c
MRRLLGLTVVCGLLVPTGAALADPAMLKKFNCIACHDNEKKKFGPPYKEVAARYAEDEGAAERLAKKIQTGGAGSWGEVPMPPHPQVSDEDALALARYILSIQ